MVRRTPAVKARPCRISRPSFEAPMRSSILRDSTGKTQGIRLRIRPPSAAKSAAVRKVSCFSPPSGVPVPPEVRAAAGTEPDSGVTES